MKTNTLFIIGGVALLGFVWLRKNQQATGNNAAPVTPAQTNPTNTNTNNPQGGGIIVNPNGLTQEQLNALTQQQATATLTNNPITTPWIIPGGGVPWAVQGGNGGGFLLPF